MDVRVFILIFSSIFQCVFGLFSDSSPCKVDLIPEKEWKQGKTFPDPISDTSVNGIILSSKFTNKKIEFPPCSSSDTLCYFSAKLLDGNVTIFANENLLKIDGDFSFQSPKKQFTQNIQFICDGEAVDLSIKVTIVDTNNHPPQFERVDGYEFSLPMPLAGNINLMQFGEYSIKVKDLDFSNNNIIFSSEYKGLTYATNINKKEEFPYSLVLKFDKFTRLSEDTSFKLKATDSGVPPKSTEINVTFKIDSEHSEPYIPVYKKPSFLFTYDAEKGKLDNVEKIEIEKTDKKIVCEMYGDMKEYFNEPEANGTEIDISLKEEFPANITEKTVVETEIFCHVEGDSENGAIADIIISLPTDKTIGTIKFSQYIFKASYDIQNDKHIFKMTEEIKVENSEKVTDDVTIQVEEKYAPYFKPETKDGNWTLTKKEDLSQEFLTGLTLNIFICLLVKDEIVDKAIVTISLPNAKEGIHFKSPIYEGNYLFGDGDDAQLEINTMDLNSQFVDIVKFNLKEYEDYFDIKQNGPSSFQLLKKEGKILPSEILKKETLILTFIIEMKLGTTSQVVETAILLHLVDEANKTTTENPGTENPCPTTSPAENECSATVWIIVIIILVIILILFIGGSLLFYFKRLRQKEHTFPYQQRVEPHFQRRGSIERFKDVSTRRPTGYIQYDPNLFGDTDQFGESDKETNNNTEANKNIPPPPPPLETFNIMNTESQKEERSLSEPSTPTLTLADELKQAVKERESRLI